jgi:hypothetical protein
VRSGLEVVPAQPHKLYDVGSSPTSAIKGVTMIIEVQLWTDNPKKNQELFHKERYNLDDNVLLNEDHINQSIRNMVNETIINFFGEIPKKGCMPAILFIKDDDA